METDATKQRQQFYRDYASGQWSMSELCDRYGISRPTGYKWVQRIEHEGMQSVSDRWSSAVLDVGCGAGTFLAHLGERHGSTGVGVDFVDLADRPALQDVEFHCGLFYEQDVGATRFDLVTMWHFLEHDYAPRRSLVSAREALTDDGRLIIEVPRLDSLTFRLFRDRWPGLQAPQHTALYDRASLLRLVQQTPTNSGNHTTSTTNAGSN